MQYIEIFTAILFFFGVIVIFLAIVHLAYIGKTCAKDVDRIVHGSEYPDDSIFLLLLRAPIYASAFLWAWSAKRSGLEDKVKQVDVKSKNLFIVNFVLFWAGGLSMLAAVILDSIL